MIFVQKTNDYIGFNTNRLRNDPSSMDLSIPESSLCPAMLYGSLRFHVSLLFIFYNRPHWLDFEPDKDLWSYITKKKMNNACADSGDDSNGY
jgi:hypothetical protein